MHPPYMNHINAHQSTLHDISTATHKQHILVWREFHTSEVHEGFRGTIVDASGLVHLKFGKMAVIVDLIEVHCVKKSDSSIAASRCHNAAWD